MAVELDLRIETGKLSKALNSFAEDIRGQLTRKTLDNLAFGIRDELQELKARDIDRPTGFTMRGTRVRKATNRNLQASVVTQPIQSDYLGWLVYGGRRKPEGRAIATPRNIKRNKFGNMPRTRDGKIKTRRSTKTISYFSGAPSDGIYGPPRASAGIYRRVRPSKRAKDKGRLVQLVKYNESVEYDKQLRWFETAEDYFFSNVGNALSEAVRFALR